MTEDIMENIVEDKAPVKKVQRKAPKAEVGDVPVPTGMEAEMKAIVDRRPTINRTPTLVEVRETRSHKGMHCISEMDADTLMAAWRVWRRYRGAEEQSEFIKTVHSMAGAGFSEHRVLPEIRLE